MRSADAQQLGGDPTHTDHTFTYEAVVEGGQVITLERTGQCPYIFCPDGVRTVHGVLTQEGVPQDGVYTFRVQRSEAASVTYRAEGGEPCELSQRLAGYFVRSLARTDIGWLDRGLRSFRGDYFQQMTAHIVRQALQQHIRKSPDMQEPFPPSDTFEVHGMDEETLMSRLHEWQMELAGMVCEIGDFTVTFRHQSVYIMYTGRYRPWGLVYANMAATYIQEHFAATYQSEALRELGYNLARIRRVQNMNAHLRTLIGETGEGEVEAAIAEGKETLNRHWQHQNGDQGRSTRTPSSRFGSFLGGLFGGRGITFEDIFFRR